MDWQQLRRMRRRARHSMRFREWPWRRKVALGAWIPVLVVAFVLFTGPNKSSSTAATPITRPPTVTTVPVKPGRASVEQIKQELISLVRTEKAVTYWVEATPPRLTLTQQLAKARWRAQRRKDLLGQHKAAVASAHHRDQKK
jgi:hypothetical protein